MGEDSEADWLTETSQYGRTESAGTACLQPTFSPRAWASPAFDLPRVSEASSEGARSSMLATRARSSEAQEGQGSVCDSGGSKASAGSSAAVTGEAAGRLWQRQLASSSGEAEDCAAVMPLSAGAFAGVMCSGYAGSYGDTLMMWSTCFCSRMT